MKKIIFALSLFTVAHPAFTAAQTQQTIQLSAQNSESLGIVQGKLIRATQIPVLYAPAKVLIPNNNEYVVSASQAGIIHQLKAATGDVVKKGDILAQIDSPNLLSLQSNYLKATSALQLANSAYQRDTSLAQDGIIAKRRVQETQSQFNAAEIDMKEAKRLLEMAGGNTHSPEKLNSNLTLRSPISGVVIERMAVVGARIDMLTPLYRVANLQTLWLEIAIPQEDIAQISVGDQVSIDNTPFTAEISLLGQSVNIEDQTILARAIVKNVQGEIRAGQKLNVQIKKLSKQIAFRIPNSGVAQHDGKAFIFIRNDTGFTITPVTIISKQDEETIISGPLKGDEIIALKGTAVLKANWLGVGSAEQ